MESEYFYADLFLQKMKIGRNEIGDLIKEVIRHNKSMKLINVSQGGLTIGQIRYRADDILVTLNDGYRGLFTHDGKLIMERHR